MWAVVRPACVAPRAAAAPEIDTVVEVGPAPSVLLVESEDATELVVGHRVTVP
jgi:hypothetical protein